MLRGPFESPYIHQYIFFDKIIWQVILNKSFSWIVDPLTSCSHQKFSSFAAKGTESWHNETYFGFIVLILVYIRVGKTGSLGFGHKVIEFLDV